MSRGVEPGEDEEGSADMADNPQRTTAAKTGFGKAAGVHPAQFGADDGCVHAFGTRGGEPDGLRGGRWVWGHLRTRGGYIP